MSVLAVHSKRCNVTALYCVVAILISRHFYQAMSFGTFPPRVYREYALFLEEITKDLDGAEKHYVLACKAAPEDASFLISLAVFLGETRGRVKDAERVFEQVIQRLSWTAVCGFI
jgi:hypothetical protein